MAAVGTLLAGQATPAVTPPPQPGGVGGALAGIANRAKDIWGSIGTDPAATAAAQVLALQLLQGTGNWQRDLGRAGQAALATHQAVKEQEASKAARAAAAKEEKARYEREQKRVETETSMKKADRIIEGIYKSAAYHDTQDEKKRNDELRAAQLELDRQRLGVERLRASREGAGTGADREQMILEAWWKKQGLDDAEALLAAKDVLGTVKQGQPLDPQKIAVQIYMGKVKATPAPSEEETTQMLESSITEADKLATRLGGPPDTTSRVERLAKMKALIQAGRVQQGAQTGSPLATGSPQAATLSGGPPAGAGAAAAAAAPAPTTATASGVLTSAEQAAANARAGNERLAGMGGGTVIKDAFARLKEAPGAGAPEKIAFARKVFAKNLEIPYGVSVPAGSYTIQSYDPRTDTFTIQTPQGMLETEPSDVIQTLWSKYGTAR